MGSPAVRIAKGFSMRMVPEAAIDASNRGATELVHELNVLCAERPPLVEVEGATHLLDVEGGEQALLDAPRVQP